MTATGRTYGLDGKIGIGLTTMISGFWRAPTTPGVDDSDHAYNLRSQTNRPQWDLNVGYQEVGDGFNPHDRLPEPHAATASPTRS